MIPVLRHVDCLLDMQLVTWVDGLAAVMLLWGGTKHLVRVVA
jgi:hypothetical protein